MLARYVQFASFSPNHHIVFLFAGSIPSIFSGLSFLETFDVTGNCLTDFEPVNHVQNLIGADAQRCVKGLPFLMLL
jgi:hypothetical protein